MTYSNKAIVNFAGGMVSPDIIARTDLPIYDKVLSWMENFIALPKGPARFRQGFNYAHHTRNNNYARFIEFQFNDEQSYLIEVTDQYFRFYKDNAIILEDTALTITGISKANPGVVTYTGTDPANGREVYISGVAGMTEVNGKFYTVANVNAGAKTFQLTDVFGNNVNTSGYTTYTSGGTVELVYQISTPYLEADIDDIEFAQNADTMYLVHTSYAPRKLTRTGHANWTLSTYTRTNDPFPSAKSITDIQDNQDDAVVTLSTSHGFTNNMQITITGVGGMTEVNGNTYGVIVVTSTTIRLYHLDTGNYVDTIGYGTYTSGGTATPAENVYPGAVAFTDDSRLVFGGPASAPERLYFSRAPSSAGAVRFDDFTTGSDPADALNFSLAPLNGKVDAIRWITNTDKYIAVGTFGSVRRMYGATEDQSVQADEITARSANSDGVHRAQPVLSGSVLFYIPRGQESIESIQYDYRIDGYLPENKNLITDNLTRAQVTRIRRQTGDPNLIWVTRSDGVLLALTYVNAENIIAWHMHTVGGSGDVEAIGVMPRANNQDQIWIIVKRTINGHTVRYVEYMNDYPDFPDIASFFTGAANKTADQTRFANYQNEVLKQSVTVDSAITYDGSSYGTDAGATLTPAATTGTGITFTASQSVFTSAMVGRQLWKKYAADGSGGGKATITGYTSGTQVTCTITTAFDVTTAIAAGDWYLTTTSVSGLDHLEGEDVVVIADGVVSTDTVASGAISGLDVASVIHVGLMYNGLMRTLPLNQGGVTGPAMNKRRNIEKVAMRFVDTAKVKFGTDLYDLVELDVSDNPGDLYTGLAEQFYPDGWENDKILYIYNDSSLPATVAALDVYMDVTDEQ